MDLTILFSKYNEFKHIKAYSLVKSMNNYETDNKGTSFQEWGMYIWSHQTVLGVKEKKINQINNFTLPFVTVNNLTVIIHIMTVHILIILAIFKVHYHTIYHSSDMILT